MYKFHLLAIALLLLPACSNPTALLATDQAQALGQPNANSPSPTLSPALPTPGATASPFDPQSLKGLTKDEAIAAAQANGYQITNNQNPNLIYLGNAAQQIILNINQATNTVTAITTITGVSPVASPTSTPIAGSPTPTATPTATTPTPAPTPTPIGASATYDQLNSCKTQVGNAFRTVPLTDINVYAGSPDANGNAIVRWETRTRITGFCRVNASNNVVELIVENGITPSPVASGDSGSQSNGGSPTGGATTGGSQIPAFW
jgi:hypothetical protein